MILAQRRHDSRGRQLQPDARKMSRQSRPNCSTLKTTENDNHVVHVRCQGNVRLHPKCGLQSEAEQERKFACPLQETIA